MSTQLLKSNEPKLQVSYLSHMIQEGAKPKASFVPKKEYRMI